MQTFRAIKHFRWGDTNIDKGQILEITPYPEIPNRHLVKLKYKKDQFIIHTKAIEGMQLLRKIEKY